MKRFLSAILILTLLLCTVGCTKVQQSVPEPLPRPDYTLGKNPSTDELRQTAVRAMHDLLAIQWCTTKGIAYHKEGSKKHFQYPSDMTFGGVIYSGASTGLFQFMEYYDSATGLVEYPGTDDEMKNNVGSACADSLLWSWNAVCNSFSCGYYPSTMVYKNGFIPVGDYTYDFELDSYYKFPTNEIIKHNGTSVIMESYAQMLPADALVSTPQDHAMMVIDEPVVVRYSGGTIDSTNSYVIIQDQRGGIGAGFYEENHGDYTVHHSGRIRQKFTFAELAEKNYIPVTAAEFIGEKAYDKAEATADGGNAKDYADFKKLTIHTNYPIALLKLIITDDNGNETLCETVLFHASDVAGPARSFDLKELTRLDTINPVVCKRIRVDVTVSTGEVLTPIDIRN